MTRIPDFRCEQLELRGDDAFKAGRFSDAIYHYMSAYDSTRSVALKAELSHKLGLSRFGRGDCSKYLDYEESASAFYGTTAPDQAADFMKEAGDSLGIVEELELSKMAYRLAEKYFSDASATTADNSLMTAWRAWSTVCKAKHQDAPVPDVWLDGARLFLEAARHPEHVLDKGRVSRASQCMAMEKLADELTEANLKSAVRHFVKAAKLDPSNVKLGVSLPATTRLLKITFPHVRIPLRLREDHLGRPPSFSAVTNNVALKIAFAKAMPRLKELDETTGGVRVISECDTAITQRALLSVISAFSL